MAQFARRSAAAAPRLPVARSDTCAQKARGRVVARLGRVRASKFAGVRDRVAGVVRRLRRPRLIARALIAFAVALVAALVRPAVAVRAARPMVRPPTAARPLRVAGRAKYAVARRVFGRSRQIVGLKAAGRAKPFVPPAAPVSAPVPALHVVSQPPFCAP